MKSLPYCLSVIFVTMTFSTPLLCNASTSDGVRIAHLFHRLKSLPLNTTSHTAVIRLVRSLVKLNPLRTGKYYKQGIARLPDDSLKELLAFKILQIIRKSNLTLSQKVKILRKIDSGETCSCPPYEPTPTPIPSPTP